MKVQDVKVGDIIQFGKYRYSDSPWNRSPFEERTPEPILWFKADKEGTLVSVYSVDSLAYHGNDPRIGHDERQNVLLVGFLNSDNDTFDLKNVCGSNAAKAAYNGVRGFLADFESWEKDVTDDAITLLSLADIRGDNRLPLFKKMGIRVRPRQNYWRRFSPYWLADSDERAQYQLLGNGNTYGVWYTTSRCGVRPKICIDPNLEVQEIDPIQTHYFSTARKAYIIREPEVLESNSYTTEDLCELFGFASY